MAKPAERSVPRGEYLRGWHAGVEAAKRVVEGFILRGFFDVQLTQFRDDTATPSLFGEMG